jgi:hypothetical protein
MDDLDFIESVEEQIAVLDPPAVVEPELGIEDFEAQIAALDDRPDETEPEPEPEPALDAAAAEEELEAIVTELQGLNPVESETPVEEVEEPEEVVVAHEPVIRAAKEIVRDPETGLIQYIVDVPVQEQE